MNPKTMRDIFEAMETVACPLKECKKQKKPSQEELNKGEISLKNLEFLANQLSVDPEDIVVLYYYAKYLTSHVYIMPNLFNNTQDETILRTKADIGALIFKVDVFGRWANSLVAKLVTAGIKGSILKSF